VAAQAKAVREEAARAEAERKAVVAAQAKADKEAAARVAAAELQLQKAENARRKTNENVEKKSSAVDVAKSWTSGNALHNEETRQDLLEATEEAEIALQKFRDDGSTDPTKKLKELARLERNKVEAQKSEYNEKVKRDAQSIADEKVVRDAEQALENAKSARGRAQEAANLAAAEKEAARAAELKVHNIPHTPRVRVGGGLGGTRRRRHSKSHIKRRVINNVERKTRIRKRKTRKMETRIRKRKTRKMETRIRKRKIKKIRTKKSRIRKITKRKTRKY